MPDIFNSMNNSIFYIVIKWSTKVCKLKIKNLKGVSIYCTFASITSVLICASPFEYFAWIKQNNCSDIDIVKHNLWLFNNLWCMDINCSNREAQTDLIIPSAALRKIDENYRFMTSVHWHWTEVQNESSAHTWVH